MHDLNRYSDAEVKSMADYLNESTKRQPKLGIVCGSGLGEITNQLENQLKVPYRDIKNFQECTVEGHCGSFVFGSLNGVEVICMQGRFHTYEGYSPAECAMPIRLMHQLGVKVLIVTNAAGAVNQSFNTGDLMVITDHVNFGSFAGNSPLRGKNESGPRFVDMSHTYSSQLIDIFCKLADELKMTSFIRRGVYCKLGGPTYETPAEVRLLRTLGIDAVGMSTVDEVTVGIKCGLKVFGLSLISNKCIIDLDSTEKVTHDDVLETSQKRAKDLQALMKAFAGKLKSSNIV